MRIKLGMPIALSELRESIGLNILPPLLTDVTLSQDGFSTDIPSSSENSITIEHISTDSREVRKGDLFISLADGEDTSDGHINEARLLGAYALRSRPSVNDELTPLEKIASHYREMLGKIKVIVAITGSTGKTTTKAFANALLSTRYITHATNGNFNNEIGVPLTILGAPPHTEALILEMGMNKFGEISRLSRTARPTICAITNIGSAHIGNLGSKQAIAKAKLEIIDGILDGGILISRFADRLNINSARNISKCTYSYDLNNEGSCLFPADGGNYRFIIDGHCVSLSFFSDTTQILEDLALALSIAYYSGVDIKRLPGAVADINEDMLRFTVSEIGGITIIDDAYNSSTESVSAALAELTKQKARNRSALVGDILEAGEFSEQIHYNLGRMLADSVDKLYLVGEMSEMIKSGATSAGLAERSIFIIEKSDNISSIVRAVHSLVDKGECILIKASHGVGLYKFKEEYERLINDAK